MRRNVLGALFLLVLATGCRENPQQMIETARFEELQRNTTHAREIYQRVLADFPNSPQAQTAREQLLELDKPAAE